MLCFESCSLLIPCVQVCILYNFKYTLMLVLYLAFPTESEAVAMVYFSFFVVEIANKAGLPVKSFLFLV